MGRHCAGAYAWLIASVAAGTCGIERVRIANALENKGQTLLPDQNFIFNPPYAANGAPGDTVRGSVSVLMGAISAGLKKVPKL